MLPILKDIAIQQKRVNFIIKILNRINKEIMVKSCIKEACEEKKKCLNQCKEPSLNKIDKNMKDSHLNLKLILYQDK